MTRKRKALSQDSTKTILDTLSSAHWNMIAQFLPTSLEYLCSLNLVSKRFQREIWLSWYPAVAQRLNIFCEWEQIGWLQNYGQYLKTLVMQRFYKSDLCMNKLTTLMLTSQVVPQMMYPNVRNLQLVNCEGFLNVANCAHLVSLEISHSVKCHSSLIENISNFPNLKHLVIENFCDTRFDVASFCHESLESLSMIFPKSSLPKFNIQFPKLQKLHLSHAALQCVDESFLLKELTCLRLYFCTELKDISMLCKVQTLEKICLIGCKVLEDIDALFQLPNLLEVNVTNTKINCANFEKHNYKQVL